MIISIRDLSQPAGALPASPNGFDDPEYAAAAVGFITPSYQINTIDPSELVLPDTPPEWQQIDADALAFLLNPQGPRNTYSPWQDKIMSDILSHRWYLLRNVPGAECVRCGRVHTFYTLGCVDRPLNGLTKLSAFIKQRLGKYTEYRAVVIGAVEPISEKRAAKLALDIKQKRRTVRSNHRTLRMKGDPWW